MDTRLDDTLEHLHRTGPEFDGWLSNHGPMAADALLRIAPEADVHRWTARYARRLDPLPSPRWAIDEEDWREYWGDPSRVGDWLQFFDRAVRGRPWRDVLATWWPRLLPGSLAAATHGLIRTGHAVRALREAETAPRLRELGQALGYWAARWQPMPLADPRSGDPRAAAQPVLSFGDELAAGGGRAGRVTASRESGPAADALDVAALEAVLDAAPRLGQAGGTRTRIALAGADREWAAYARRAPEVPSDVLEGMQCVRDAAVGAYDRGGHGNPVMMVHAATAPRAAALVLPAPSVDDRPLDPWVAGRWVRGQLAARSVGNWPPRVVGRWPPRSWSIRRPGRGRSAG
ncbi:MAG: questin oxidase family protein [Kineosporiaceae bacterium]